MMRRDPDETRASRGGEAQGAPVDASGGGTPPWFAFRTLAERVNVHSTRRAGANATAEAARLWRDLARERHNDKSPTELRREADYQRDPSRRPPTEPTEPTPPILSVVPSVVPSIVGDVSPTDTRSSDTTPTTPTAPPTIPWMWLGVAAGAALLVYMVRK